MWPGGLPRRIAANRRRAAVDRAFDPSSPTMTQASPPRIPGFDSSLRLFGFFQ